MPSKPGDTARYKRDLARKTGLCTGDGCIKPRNGLSIYCNGHRKAVRRNGDPSAKALPRALLTEYEKRIERLFKTNERHEGLTKALQIVDKMLNLDATGLAPRHPKTLAAGAMRYLREQGADPKAVLVATTAVWCIREDRHRVFRSDDAFKFAVINAMLSKVRWTSSAMVAGRRRVFSSHTPGTRAKEFLAEYVIDRLLPFFRAVGAGISAQANVNATSYLVLSTPFEPRLPIARTEHEAAAALFKSNVKESIGLANATFEAAQRDNVMRLGQMVIDWIASVQTTDTSEPAATSFVTKSGLALSEIDPDHLPRFNHEDD